MKLVAAFLLSVTASQIALASPVLEQQAREAFQFAFPVAEMMRVREDQESRAQANGRTMVNRIVHRTVLTNASERGVTAPNNDTLYSASWLDLSAGPVTLEMPTLSSRYHSVALLDLFTDHQAILGTRTTGGRGGRYLIAGPGWRGPTPAGATLVRVDVNELYLIVRVLVDGASDLPAAVSAQAAFRIVPTERSPSRPMISRAGSDPRSMLALVNEALGRGPLPATHAKRVARFAAAGIQPGRVDAWERLPPKMRAIWAAKLPQFKSELKQGWLSVGTARNNWTYPKPGLGQFGTDDLYRARVALSGLHALPPEEAMYLVSDRDGSGTPFDGRSTYRFSLPKNIPVDGFWSVSMYKPDSDGRWFFIENAIQRYAIGNRTAGLVKSANGETEIIMSDTPPAQGAANWLPAPSGPFRLTFRAYLPGAPLLDGRFVLPPVERISSQ